MQGAELAATGTIRFSSKDELKRYLKSLVEKYQLQNQSFGDQLGGLLRTLEQEKAAAKAQPKNAKDAPQKTQAKGWVKMGSMLVNVSDPSGAIAEVLFQLHEDAKVKLAKSTDALKSFEELSSQTIPEAGAYHLLVRNGVPERIIVDLHATHKDTFSFSADFKLV